MNEAVEYLRRRAPLRPGIGLILGSGLGALANELDDRTEIPYADIPGWPRATAEGHAGKLIFGKLGAREVAVMAGRVHLYEGYSPAQVVYPVRVLGKLGVRALILTNAAGGINLSYRRGSLVLISDHINLQGANPLVGPNDDTLGPRFPDMSEAYSRRYRQIAREVAAARGRSGAPARDGRMNLSSFAGIGRVIAGDHARRGSADRHGSTGSAVCRRCCRGTRMAAAAAPGR
ncbi:MAG: purine-nucleoside phosphorylase [Alicyclobacillus shizuokensis]|nr:purine-nucleoside phosphorylase [Alicyclobacillus shizuokensis]